MNTMRGHHITVLLLYALSDFAATSPNPSTHTYTDARSTAIQKTTITSTKTSTIWVVQYGGEIDMVALPTCRLSDAETAGTYVSMVCSDDGESVRLKSWSGTDETACFNATPNWSLEYTDLPATIDSFVDEEGVTHNTTITCIELDEPPDYFLQGRQAGLTNHMPPGLCMGRGSALAMGYSATLTCTSNMNYVWISHYSSTEDCSGCPEFSQGIPSNTSYNNTGTWDTLACVPACEMPLVPFDDLDEPVYLGCSGVVGNDEVLCETNVSSNVTYYARVTAEGDEDIIFAPKCSTEMSDVFVCSPDGTRVRIHSFGSGCIGDIVIIYLVQSGSSLEGLGLPYDSITCMEIPGGHP